MGKTKIDWCDRVWNPITGCMKVSQGCRNCYAERMAFRLRKMGKPAYQNAVDDRGHWTGKIHLVPEKLEEPLHWKKPARIFVNSMSDLFHEKNYEREESFLNEVFAIMAACSWHIFMVLTKRPYLMEKYITAPRRDIYIEHSLETIYSEHGWYSPEFEWPLPNVWLGISVEDQATADERIPLLLQTPAVVRFVSYEPALGPVDFRSWFNSFQPMPWPTIAYPKIHLVIMGCESGPGARSMPEGCERSTRDQCVAAGVKFFLKQMMINGKLVHIPELDGRQWAEFPEA